MKEDNKQAILQPLTDKRAGLLKKRKPLQLSYYATLGIAILATVVVPVVVWFNRDYPFTGFFILYIIIPISILPIFRTQLRDLEDDLKNIDLEIDLKQYEATEREIRAEKLLVMNNFQLRRYYDLNLSQNIWVFGLGIFCIMMGLCVIAVTLYLVLRVATSLDVQIVTGVVGSVGSFMTNYIAAIYLKMHASATSNLSTFHSRLVDTHQSIFGNLLASRIDDDNIRWQTLSQLALNVSKHEESKSSQ